tara:strand:- start:882 stop:1223 length:342 start_codon:yes stop_codon:yes gene_type:complete
MSIEHEDNPSPGRALTEWELAGALLGHLNDAFPFGTINMEGEPQSATGGGHVLVFTYRWSFGVVMPSSSETKHPFSAAKHYFSVQELELRRESDRLDAYARKLVLDAMAETFR